MELLINVALTAAGLAMLCFGGSWLVMGGVGIARRLGISDMVIGMTVVAYGTSTPEFAASLAAAGAHSQIILGNIVGSNIANIGMVIGISAVLVPLAVRQTIKKELFVMVGASVLLIILSIDGVISEYDGMLMISLLIAFTILTYRSVKKQTNSSHASRAPRSARFYLKSLGLIGIGIAFLYAGSELTIDNAVKIAESFDLSEKIIGITIIAVGTSLPELITSIIAIRKGHTDIGIGNIIGSSIYNVLMIMGAASIFAGIAVTETIYSDYAVMMAFSLILLVILKTRIVSRKIGVALALGYAAYLAASLLSETQNFFSI